MTVLMALASILFTTSIGLSLYAAYLYTSRWNDDRADGFRNWGLGLLIAGWIVYFIGLAVGFA